MWRSAFFMQKNSIKPETGVISIILKGGVIPHLR